jgi:glycosyltransferase involved in cell wall biosynthesis
MPNALVEAMAVGLPCISTNCKTGPRDLIDHGENGFLVAAGDAEQIAEAVLRVAAMDASHAEEMGRKARAKVLDLCSESNSLKKLIKLIEA